MASTSASGLHGQPWLGGPPHQVPPPNADDFSPQVRPMGLKVHYTFDKDSQVRCLARWPQILPIQALPVDEHTVIGVVDLRTCLQAVAQGSPEIVSQQEYDYTIYAFDYSEPDTPLVGQGILSWALDANNDSQLQSMVTGRVTTNPLAVFSSGIRETLEVKLKLTAVPKMQKPVSLGAGESQGPPKSAPTPTDTSEWNSFIQSNPTLGRSANVTAVPSPALEPVRMDYPLAENRPILPRSGSFSLPPLAQKPSPTIEPAKLAMKEELVSAGPPPATDLAAKKPARPSRPSSRASRREPTGRPRGRPRKKPLETGNTSAAEEVTDADDGPQRKRAKITQTDWPSSAPLATAPESLRVAASISGSLRNMRPIAAGGETTAPSHLQDIPRAPTPVPQVPLLSKQPKRRVTAKPRAKSMAEFDGPPTDQPGYNDGGHRPALSQDARSPTDSIAHSPDQVYTPADSPADLGSSPPVPRSSAYLQSSPSQSSPILPPMPMMPQHDSGFMSGGVDDFFDEEDIPQELPPPVHKVETQMHQGDEAPLAPIAKPAVQKRKTAENPFPFREVNPGPPELLPATSIFNPRGAAMKLNKPIAPQKRSNPQLKRANTEPALAPAAAQPTPIPAATQAPNELSAQALDQHPRFPSQPTPAPAMEDFGDVDSSLLTMSMAELNAGPTFEVGGAPQPESQPQAELHVAVPEAKMEPIPMEEQQLPPPPPRQPSRNSSAAPKTAPPVPASDPVGAPIATVPKPFYSEAPCPPSEDIQPDRSNNKNYVKKQSIKDKLQEAIEKGEMPPFCNNCGAIETPTWRKIWTQDHQGKPGYFEYSEKPGHVTAIDILERDADGQPTMYRLVKKNLANTEDKREWNELLLCNPCGIWLSKFKTHRPPDRWDKDAARLNQTRRKRDRTGNSSRSKKPRTKSDAQINPTSEAYMTTDPLGLGEGDQESPKDQEGAENSSQSRRQSVTGDGLGGEQRKWPQASQYEMPSLIGSPKSLGFGSTHSRASRGSGTVDSPIPIEDDLGTTRRLLFPSPRKDGVAKVLGEVAVNVVQLAPDIRSPKEALAGKENLVSASVFARTPMRMNDDLLDQELFGTPPARPSTPPSKSANNGPFKTPTRPTPSHRPITRSISRTIQSVKSIPKSPNQALHLLQRTPTKTPRSGAPPSLSASRRTPRNQHLHAHFLDMDSHHAHHHHFESPFTATLNQLLSEANDFTADSSSHGLADLDLSSLPNLDSDGAALHDHLVSGTGAGPIDFATLFSTDMIMPSSPPLMRTDSGGSTSFDGTDLWGGHDESGAQ